MLANITFMTMYGSENFILPHLLRGFYFTMFYVMWMNSRPKKPINGDSLELLEFYGGTILWLIALPALGYCIFEPSINKVKY